MIKHLVWLKIYIKKFLLKMIKNLSKVSDVKDVIKKRTIYKSDYIDEVILTFKIDVSSLSCFDKYKLDWYLSFFLDIIFLNIQKLMNILIIVLIILMIFLLIYITLMVILLLM